jgi:hypothetical protein
MTDFPEMEYKPRKVPELRTLVEPKPQNHDAPPNSKVPGQHYTIYPHQSFQSYQTYQKVK